MSRRHPSRRAPSVGPADYSRYTFQGQIRSLGEFARGLGTATPFRPRMGRIMVGMVLLFVLIPLLVALVDILVGGPANYPVR
ncbi:MAG: hypothetical protein ACRDKW_12080 [Actinomycetota bacterium]